MLLGPAPNKKMREGTKEGRKKGRGANENEYNVLKGLRAAGQVEASGGLASSQLLSKGCAASCQASGCSYSCEPGS